MVSMLLFQLLSPSPSVSLCLSPSLTVSSPPSSSFLYSLLGFLFHTKHTGLFLSRSLSLLFLCSLKCVFSCFLSLIYHLPVTIFIYAEWKSLTACISFFSLTTFCLPQSLPVSLLFIIFHSARLTCLQRWNKCSDVFRQQCKNN